MPSVYCVSRGADYSENVYEIFEISRYWKDLKISMFKDFLDFENFGIFQIHFIEFSICEEF